MSVIRNSLLLATDEATGYNLTKSLRFRSSASAYLNRTPASAGNQQKFTISTWVKRGALGAIQTILSASNGVPSSDTNFFALSFNADDTIGVGGGLTTFLTTTQVFRDPSAWYHIVLALDTTQATASNRAFLYVNGVKVTAFSSSAYMTQNLSTPVNQNGIQQNIASSMPYLTRYFDGYMAEVNFIDGQQLTPSSFGSTNSTTGVWQPAQYTGTYGTNGFYLPFTDVATTSGSNAGLGKDFSGNGNYWTTNNISVTVGATYDSMTDVPTLTSATAANYAVFNPLNIDPAVLGVPTLTNGNLTATGGNQVLAFATMAITTGKFYWEYTILDVPTTPTMHLGATVSPYTSTYLRAYRYDTGDYFNGTAWVAYGATFTTNDVIGVALDMTNQTIEFFKNNTSQGQKTSIGLTGQTMFPLIYINSSPGSVAINLGQQGFKYTPPTGFVALNTYNLPDSTIVAGNTVMDATTYTGNNTTNVISNAGSMKPDLVWIKSRSNISQNTLQDSIRGVNKYLISNSTAAEGTDGSVTSFNSGGFSLTTDAGVSYNANGYTYVGWQWQAGQGVTSSNTSGSITSTVSVNASAGFSVVTYTGNSSAAATVGHGLGVKPSFMIIRNRDEAFQWMAWHSSLSTQLGYLSATDAFDGSRYSWALSSTQPTSTLITLGDASGNGASTNKNGIKYVAYCWSEIAGFSKFGSYTGNGSTDGPFVYTGFRPKFVIIKRTDTTSQWSIWDSSRNTSNAANSNLWSDSSEVETTSSSYDIDFLSNGIKFRTSSVARNASGGTYVYACFAENPFKNSLAR